MTTKEVNPLSNSALATTGRDLKTLGQVLEARKGEFQKLLPKHLGVGKLLKMAVNSVAKTPKLQECSIESILRCVYAAAELGLEPGGVLGQCWLVPYKGVATFVLGYKGLLRLVYNSGDVSSVRAVVVNAKDRFRYSEGIEQRIVHEPYLDGDPGDLVRVYSVARFKDGTATVEVMSRSQVDAIMARSRARDDGPWKTDYGEMAKKSVVKRHGKYLPLSDEARDRIERDEDVVDGEVVAADPTERAETRAKRKLNIVDVPQPSLEAQLAASVAAVSGDLSVEEKAEVLRREQEQSKETK